MRRAVGILSTAIVPVFFATMAFAADPYGTTAGAVGGFMGEHTVTGKIISIDKEKGHVKVDAQGEKMDLHFPSSALQNLKEGDQVTVSLGIKAAGTSGTSGTSGTRSGTPSVPGMPGSRGSEERGTDVPGGGSRY
jgi:hypothetical protein